MQLKRLSAETIERKYIISEIDIDHEGRKILAQKIVTQILLDKMNKFRFPTSQSILSFAFAHLLNEI